MIRIAPGARHDMSHIAIGHVRRWQISGTVIPDSSAAAIASWWQSSGRIGRYLASLASGMPVTFDALSDDIDATIQEADNAHTLDASDRAALEALRAWGQLAVFTQSGD